MLKPLSICGKIQNIHEQEPSGHLTNNRSFLTIVSPELAGLFWLSMSEEGWSSPSPSLESNATAFLKTIPTKKC